MDEKPLRVHRTCRPMVRGAAGRRAAVLTMESKQRDFEALMHTIVTCTTLWGGFWFQFVIGFMYNSPAIHTLSQGNWFVPYVGFYLPVHGPAAISLAECFAWLSVFGSLLALGGAWHWTRGVGGRWRMRLLVAGFAGWLSLWTLAGLAAEDAAWQALADRRAAIGQELLEARDEGMIRWLRSEKRWIEQTFEMRPDRNAKP